MKGNLKDFKNKLLISNVKLLIPNLDKTYYLNIIINDDKSYKTKLLEFKKSNIVELNQLFELEEINSIESIRFQIYEKSSIFSNAVFKGEVNKSNILKDEYNNQSMCFLSNNNQENSLIVYFNYELNPDLLASFDNNLKILESENKSKNGQKSALANLKDLASGDNAENFSKFVHNMEYIRTLETTVIDIVKWNNAWKTLSVLFIITYSILYWKLVFVLSPLLIIYLHIYNRDRMTTFSHKSTKHDNLANLSLITKTIDITNRTIDSYENILEVLQYSDKKIYEEIYLNLLKFILINLLFIVFGFFDFKILFLTLIWSGILLNNPSFRAFIIFLVTFINNKILSNFDSIPRVAQVKKQTEFILLTVIPFANIIRKVLKVKKEIMVNPLNKNTKQVNSLKNILESINDNTVIITNDVLSSTNSQELLKFEIYENERWWMFVGWAKNLILNERPLWSDVTGKHPMEKNTVFLPSNEYQWTGDWKVEAGKDCDEQGWEYSSDFSSIYSSNSNGKYVRRRKWVRYAKKNK
jgi:hypothetical protein